MRSAVSPRVGVELNPVQNLHGFWIGKQAHVLTAARVAHWPVGNPSRSATEHAARNRIGPEPDGASDVVDAEQKIGAPSRRWPMLGVGGKTIESQASAEEWTPTCTLRLRRLVTPRAARDGKGKQP